MYNQYLLFPLQFTIYISHELGNSQILKLTLRGTPSRIIPWKVLIIERTKNSFWRHTQIREENNVCQILFRINSQSSGGAGGACNFIKKEALAQVFSCEFCKISKNIFFTEHLRTTASKIHYFARILCLASWLKILGGTYKYEARK